MDCTHKPDELKQITDIIKKLAVSIPIWNPLFKANFVCVFLKSRIILLENLILYSAISTNQKIVHLWLVEEVIEGLSIVLAFWLTVFWRYACVQVRSSWHKSSGKFWNLNEIGFKTFTAQKWDLLFFVQLIRGHPFKNRVLG